MEEPTPEQQKISTNDKGCQTETACNGSPEPVGPTSSSTHAPEYCVEPGDPPLLQKQIQTSRSGIQQIIECFRSGTTQLRHILLKEVDTIFECKLCRSLFRGLPNLITHKEFYCFPRLPEPDGSSRDARQSAATKELIEAIYPRRDEYVVRLEPISTNQNAIFQHVSREDKATCHASTEHHKEKEKEKEKDKEKEAEPNHTTDPEEKPGTDASESEAETQEEDEEAEEEDVEEEDDDEEEELQGLEEEDDDEDATEGEGDHEGDSPGKESNSDVHLSDGAGPVVQGVTITCCMCGKDFNSRQAIRRHCRKMHQNRLEELRKFTEMRTVPISLLSMVKVPSGVCSPVKTPYGKSCPVCYKAFATKANVRRHFDEVHRGLRRDLITPDIATKPGVPLSLETTASPAPQYNMTSGKCLVCKRKYSSQARLKRHLRIVHKIRPKLATAISPQTPSSTGKKAVKRPASPPVEVQRRGRPKKYRREEHFTLRKQQQQQQQEEENNDGDGGPAMRRPKLALGFDFKLLYCKLCKRQFSSRQNLDKHIELHTDNDNEIFIKFYRCPLCSYETRRKRDVLRHITVVHKKPSNYLTKIMATIESRAVKKPAELVLKNASGGAKRSQLPASPAHLKEEVNGRHEPAIATTPQSTRKHTDAAAAATPSTPVTRRHELPPPTPPVTRKHSLFLSSPPVTRKSDHHHHHSLTPHTRKQEAPQPLLSPKQEPVESQHSTEVKVTKNFSLHACDMCGRAFAKKLYLETHKRSHRNAAATAASTSDDHRTQGVSTRSKALL
ncbi:zinc finger protein 800b [Clupea harengus]|uniref:Zinc finger protein 800b n=1 Tax=Clupea harengus TaxID=7950 RepID=A0A6P8GIR5_CLUHA|nr:zinc finger protein 800b [Clupea harengus]